MATKIRLTRGGRMHAPFYRIGVFDERTRRDGASIENLGFYNPLARGQDKELEFDVERAKYWLSVGAVPSETVASFLKKLGVSYKAERSGSRRRRNTKRSKARVAAEKQNGKIHGKARRKAKAAAKAAKTTANADS